jgi:hypothetical protein
MTQLLILSTSILATGPVVDTGDSLQTPFIIYPKSLIPGYQIQDVSLPSDFSVQTYQWVSGQLQKIPVPPVNNLPQNAGIVTQSFNSSLRRKANSMQTQGKTFEAVQLLLQAQGVQK